jgi:hypothetical protein
VKKNVGRKDNRKPIEKRGGKGNKKQNKKAKRAIKKGKN